MARSSRSANWTLADSYKFISSFVREYPSYAHPRSSYRLQRKQVQKRHFQDYFVTHLPSSSLHPDSRSAATGLPHKFPRKDSVPHDGASRSAPAVHPSISRETTVVRIPLKSAKHHFGVSVSRGSRPYNEDSYQAGVIEIPAFAKRMPVSLTRKPGDGREGTSAQGASGDPQVFYVGAFDGHGGAECSGFLREQLHDYIEKAAEEMELQSSLPGNKANQDADNEAVIRVVREDIQRGKEILDSEEVKKVELESKAEEDWQKLGGNNNPASPGVPPAIQEGNMEKIKRLEKRLIQNWKELVGGYFRRFKPAYFSLFGDYHSPAEEADSSKAKSKGVNPGAGVEEVVTYAFLKADYDFVLAQVSKEDEGGDVTKAEKPLNDEEVFGRPHIHAKEIGGPKRFRGGSTCSIAMISTPSPIPFWNPSTTSSMLVAHVGDTRVIICSTATGSAIPLTTNHYPSSPVESNRLRRYATSFVTDSFGEERISGLANTRAFGDIASKRIGVSAEPEINRVELGAAEYSFVVLVSDGVSGVLSDQEIVDIVKEAKTPEQAARDVVSFATEVTTEGDNATCIVVRMGGWERRQEGGLGSLGTKESRDWKTKEASEPRRPQ